MLIRSLKRLFNFRSTLRNPVDDWLRDALHIGTDTQSGIRVNEETSLTFSAVYCAIRVIAESCSQLPFHVYQKKSDGSKVRVMRNHVDSLLNEQFNSVTSALVGRETTSAFCAGWGNGYNIISFSSFGEPAELEPVPSSLVKVELLKLKGGAKKLVYTVSRHGEADKKYEPSEMLHVPALSFDGICGKSPLRLAREAIGLGLATEQHGANFFGEGARPGGIIYHPAHFKDNAARARFRDAWQSTYGGENQHRTAILEDGLKWESVAIPNEDAQFLSTRQFQVTEIARWFRLPPHFLADLERSTFSNIEQQSLDFLVHSLVPWLKRWEAEVNRKLLGFDSGLYAEHNTAAFMRADTAARSDFYKTMREIGVFSVNDILSLENMNKIGEEGDERHVPMNWSVLGEEEEPAPAPAPEPEPEEPEEPEEEQPEEEDDNEESEENSRHIIEAFKPMLAQTLQRFIVKECKAIGSACKKHESDEDFKQHVYRFYEEHEAVVHDAVKVILDSLSRCLGTKVKLDIASAHVGHSRQAIVDVINSGNRELLPNLLLSWMKTRASVDADRQLACLEPLKL